MIKYNCNTITVFLNTIIPIVISFIITIIVVIHLYTNIYTINYIDFKITDNVDSVILYSQHNTSNSSSCFDLSLLFIKVMWIVGSISLVIGLILSIIKCSIWYKIFTFFSFTICYVASKVFLLIAYHEYAQCFFNQLPNHNNDLYYWNIISYLVATIAIPLETLLTFIKLIIHLGCSIDT